MIDPRIERMIEETRQQASLTPASTRDLREAIESSPFLSDLMVKAIEADSLRKITFDPPSNARSARDILDRTRPGSNGDGRGSRTDWKAELFRLGGCSRSQAFRNPHWGIGNREIALRTALG